MIQVCGADSAGYAVPQVLQIFSCFMFWDVYGKYQSFSATICMEIARRFQLLIVTVVKIAWAIFFSPKNCSASLKTSLLTPWSAILVTCSASLSTARSSSLKNGVSHQAL